MTTLEAQHEVITDLILENKKLKQERDEAREEIKEWKTLCLWGGTPEHIHGFIRGQQSRIQHLECERDEARGKYDIMTTTITSNSIWVAALNEATDIAAKFANEDAAAAKSCSDFDTSMAFVYQRDRSRAIENAIRKVCNERDAARTELEEYRSIAENIGAVKAVSEKEKAICERNESLEKLKPLRQSLRDSQDEVLRLTFENREISQELDKARDTIMKIEEIFIDSEDMHDDWMKVGNIARTYLEK